VKLISNPVLQEILSRLRDKDTTPKLFRGLMRRAGMFIAYEISRELPMDEYVVKTPLGESKGIKVRDDLVVIIAVLRAALPLACGMLDVLSNASIGFISARRIEESIKISEGGIEFDIDIGYVNIPNVKGRYVIISDPMLATASTILKVINFILSDEPKKVMVASIIASKYGIERLEKELIRYKISIPIALYTLAIDPELNDKGFIVPGLGDAGDRAFNT